MKTLFGSLLLIAICGTLATAAYLYLVNPEFLFQSSQDILSSGVTNAKDVIASLWAKLVEFNNTEIM